jgi:AcrR family transcriptional regulator
MKTKEKIVESTFLLSMEYGYDNVSIKQIKEKSGIAASSIYHHYKNKDAILSYMIQKYFVEKTIELKKLSYEFEGTFIEKLRFIYYRSIGIDIQNNKKPIRKINGKTIDYIKFYLMISSIYHQHPEYRNLFDNTTHNVIQILKESVDEFIYKKELKINISPNKMDLFLFTNIKGFIYLWMTLSDSDVDEIIDANLEAIKEIIN